MFQRYLLGLPRLNHIITRSADDYAGGQCAAGLEVNADGDDGWQIHHAKSETYGNMGKPATTYCLRSPEKPSEGGTPPPGCGEG